MAASRGSTRSAWPRWPRPRSHKAAGRYCSGGPAPAPTASPGRGARARFRRRAGRARRLPSCLLEGLGDAESGGQDAGRDDRVAAQAGGPATPRRRRSSRSTCSIGLVVRRCGEDVRSRGSGGLRGARRRWFRRSGPRRLTRRARRSSPSRGRDRRRDGRARRRERLGDRCSPRLQGRLGQRGPRGSRARPRPVGPGDRGRARHRPGSQTPPSR